ncbi:hypothetical protein MN116_002057 [Schistosoma mekongi]|uniref:Uncharacterized protein n=1 Tax=Schistosoma mekongi TaxID=38744 RepID=A0AAE2D817_SCHME|nr:hypothetical protein MN116_002057 [Schistosoma mekongi]
MVDILSNPISHLVIGEEWLVKLINHLKSSIGDNAKSPTSSALGFESLLQYIKKIVAIFEEIESDLIHLENKIHETRKTVYTLAHQFRRIGRFCLSEIPTVVQKEHDQASNNLTALRWNIKKTQEEYNKISTRLKTLTATKKSIESEISQLTGCTSLVNEKSLTTEAELKEIIDRTIEVTETLTKMNTKLNETQIHYNAFKRKSEEIRTNLASDVCKAEQNLIDAQNKLKDAINIEPKLIEETINMQNKIQSITLHIQTLNKTIKDYQQTFNELKQQLIQLNKNYTNQQILLENLFLWINENEKNLINQFNGKLMNEINQLNQLLHNNSEKYYQIKMNEIKLQTINDCCKKRILDYQNEIAKYRKSIELLESRLTTAQDLLQVGNVDYNQAETKHSSLTDDLELTKSRTKAEQEEKQNMLKYLQHKIEEEYEIKSKLMTDLENSFKEFEKLQQNGYQKRLQLEAIAKQSESNVENIKLELNAIRLNHSYYSEQLNSIQNEYNQFQSDWNQEYTSMCDKIQTLDDSVMKSKMQFNELNTKLKEMTTEENFLREKHNKLHLSLLALMKVRLRGAIRLSQLRCTIVDLTKTNKSLIEEINILKKQNEQIDQLQITRQLQQINLMKSRDVILKKLKEELKEKLSLNLSISDQYIKMQGEQSKLLSLFYLAVTNSMLDQNQLFNAEQISALWARILRQRNYWELKLQAKQEILVDNLLSQNHCINQQINEVRKMHIKPIHSLECKI